MRAVGDVGGQRRPRPPGSSSPSAASRCLGPVGRPSGGLRPLEVGDEVLGVGAGKDRHQLPAVLAPGVEDLLGRVHEQRHGGVLPGRWSMSVMAAMLAGGGAASRLASAACRDGPPTPATC